MNKRDSRVLTTRKAQWINATQNRQCWMCMTPCLSVQKEDLYHIFSSAFITSFAKNCYIPSREHTCAHTLTDSSPEPLARNLPSPEMATQSTASSCPFSSRIGIPVPLFVCMCVCVCVCVCKCVRACVHLL